MPKECSDYRRPLYLAWQRALHWLATVLAAFITVVSITYILQAPEGLQLPTNISYPPWGWLLLL